MANEIQASYDTGKTLYALIFNAAGQVWDVTNTLWTAYAAGSIDDYDVQLSEIATATGQYRGTFPSSIAAGVYSVVLLEQAGAGPVVADDQRIGDTGIMHWDGAAELSISSDSQIDRSLGLSASYDSTTVKLGLWLEEQGQKQTDAASIIDVEIWNAATDTQVVDLGDDLVDSVDGVFYFSAAASLAYNTPYYVKATINKAGNAYAMQSGLVRI